MDNTKSLAYVLNDLQKSFYEKNGYLVVPRLFLEDECETLLNTMYSCADEKYSAILNPDRPGFLISQTLEKIAGFESLSQKSDLIDNLFNVSKLMRKTMKDPRISAILETLQGREVVGLMSQMLFKKAGSPYASQAWQPHQDNNYIQNQNAQYITINLFLEDADKENGTMYMYPGTHKFGLFPCENNPSYREQIGTNPGNRSIFPEEFEKIKVDVDFKKGDLLVLNGNTIHGSHPNLSKTRSRPLYSCSYISKGEYFIPGNNARRTPIDLHEDN